MSNYRSKCLEAKGEQCHLCGSDGYIEVHHVDGDRKNNCLSNLIPVCMDCHSKIHRGKDGFENWYKQLRPGAKHNADIRPDEDDLLDEVGEIVDAEISVRTLEKKMESLDKVLDYCESRVLGRVTDVSSARAEIKTIKRFVSRVERGVYNSKAGQLELEDFE